MVSANLASSSPASAPPLGCWCQGIVVAAGGCVVPPTPGTQQGDLHPARAVVPTPEPWQGQTWILPAGCLCQQTVMNGLVVEEELAHMLNQELYFLEIR